jgi:arylsulfatase A
MAMCIPHTITGRQIRSSFALSMVVLLQLSLAICSHSMAGETNMSGREHPNIIVILCDDLGVGDVGAFNAESKIPTPRLDELARQGMRLADCHSGSAVCSPTRYGIMCGRYAWRTRLQQGVLGGLSPSLISPNQLTVPKMLKGQGYKTACIGKWHLGMDWQVIEGKSVNELSIEKEDQNWSVRYDQPFIGGPLAAGFDEYFGISGSLDMVPYTFLRNDRVEIVPTTDRSFPMMIGGKRQTRRGPAAENFDAEDVLPRLTQESVNFINRHSTGKSDQPFFLYIAFASPHTPIVPSKEWRDKSNINPYADFVMQQDGAVGKILDALNCANLSDNTLVVFTSDNGCSPEVDFAQLKKMGHDPSNTRRGAKSDIFEGGHLVPTIVRWPGRIPANSLSAQTMCLTDLMATLADVADAQLPEHAGPDSFSWLPIFENPDSGPIRSSTVHHSINGSFAIRSGPYKLIFCGDSGGWSQPQPDSKKDPESDMQLYNLESDPGESHNLFSSELDKAKKLSKEMESLIENGRSNAGPRLSNDVEVNLWRYAKRPD